ncbi:MAG: competence/damage-inducible protein A [Spirochaetes bacterium]|nr:competence/damage-inducible protein A [Spirochaetota bacterium]
MIKAAILTIGTEIMEGQIDDTNATFLCQTLLNQAIKVIYRMNVEDKLENICLALEFVYDQVDIIITTGGLGPTDDDLTREAFARFLKTQLVYDEHLWQDITRFFNKIKYKPAYNNKKQAYLLPGSQAIPNKNGTAPGIYLHQPPKTIILLPGPPAENQPMMNHWVIKKMHKDIDLTTKLYKKIFRVYNLGESNLTKLLNQYQTDQLEIGTYFSQKGWIDIHFSRYYHENIYEVLDKEVEKYFHILKENQINFSEAKDIALLVLEKLKELKKTIAFAESITGGHLSAELVRYSGASQVFAGAFVTYSNDLKEKILGVNKETLKNYGAVSDQTVSEMAKGLAAKSAADYNIAISGIAGPDGGSEEKPVGTVYFGFNFNNEMKILKHQFIGHRQRIINKCITYVYHEIYQQLCSELS